MDDLDQGMRGRILGGVRLGRRVAAGLLADVYEGHHPIAGRVAVKVLPTRVLGQESAEARLIREAEVLARLDHPGLVKVHHLDFSGDVLFVVMEWVDAANLQWLGEQRPLAPLRTLLIARGLCDALRCLHAEGLVHRDLKPANVCVRASGQPVLMDLSLVKDLTATFELTQTGTVMGTMSYLPPEQAQGSLNPVSPRGDLYSLGVTLYWLLSGALPFRGRTAIDTLVKALTEDAPPPSTHNPSLPPAVDALVGELMAKQPADRPPGAPAVLQRIDELLRHEREAISRARPPRPRRSRRRTGSGRLMALSE